MNIDAAKRYVRGGGGPSRPSGCEPCSGDGRGGPADRRAGSTDRGYDACARAQAGEGPQRLCALEVAVSVWGTPRSMARLTVADTLVIKLHTSAPQLLILAALVLGFGAGSLKEGSVLWVSMPALVISVFLALRTQEVVRNLPARLSQDISVFVMHLSVLSAAGALLGMQIGYFQDVSLRDIAMTLWAYLMLCAALQAARNGSAIAAYTAAILGLTSLTAIALGADAVGVTDEKVIAVILGGCVVCVGALARYIVRLDTTSVVRKVLIGIFLVLGPVPGIMFTIALLAPNPSDLTPLNITISVVASIASMGIFLRLTSDARRTLASAMR